MKHQISRMLVFTVVVASLCYALTGCLPGAKTDSGSGAVLQTVSSTALSGSRTYVGSPKCQQCHSGEYAQWQESWHAKIVQPFASAYIGSGTIAETAYTYDATGAKGSTIAYADWVARTGGAGAWSTHGGRWKQRFLQKFDNVVNGVTYTDWKISGAQWNTMDGNWGGAPAGHWDSWKRHCNWCHVSGVDKTNLYSDKVEIGVGCEACHGPGSAHVAATSNEERRAAIVKPSNLSKKAQAAVCGQCHNRGKTSSKYSDGETMDFPVSYTLGDESIPDWNIDATGYWNSAETNFSKRVPTKHRMQYPDLMYSKHFGNTACSDCHRGHNFRIENLSDNNLCIRCHSTDKKNNVISATEGLVAHAKHSYSTTNTLLKSQLLCITCHMVRTAKTAISYDQAGHTFMKFTPAVTGDGGKTYSPSTCSQSKLGCHAAEPSANLSETAYNTPVAGSLIDKWKKAVASGKTVTY